MSTPTALRPLAAMAIGFVATAALMGCASMPARTIARNLPADPPAATSTLPAPLTVAPTAPPPPTKPPCEGERVATLPGAPLDCDVQPPQALDVWYPGSDGIEQDYFQMDCDHMGGQLEWSYDHDQFVCRGVDY